MQTFLPYEDFAETASVLDRQRLGKQRVETLQIMQTLAGISRGKGWINHPATKMWKGHEATLLRYQIAICSEWKSRGYKDTCLEKTFDAYDHIDVESSSPEWLGSEDIHASHRSNLLRKNFQYYSAFGWTEPDNLEYVWPV
jgi:hypothetical protein